MAIRCLLSQEESCIGHDCIDRCGTPCIYDAKGRAGLDDVLPYALPVNEMTDEEINDLNGIHEDSILDD